MDNESIRIKADERVQELLKPRYKVIALWPFERETSIGEIYKEPTVPRGGQWTQTWKWWDEMAKHPHLFKPLAWWEERSPEEMPEYVKHAGIGRVAKVNFWDLEATSSWFMFLDNEVHPYAPGGSALENSNWLPSTEAEYTDYLTQNKHK